MQLLISDTNIIIDMQAGHLIEVMFRLPETFAVPNILYEEELMEHHPELPGYGLRVLEINAHYMRESFRLRGLYNKPSQNDLFALVLAKQERCPLLTGDRNLRAVAEREEVTVRGTLWLIERLVQERKITISGAEQAYERMKQEGRQGKRTKTQADNSMFTRYSSSHPAFSRLFLTPSFVSLSCLSRLIAKCLITAKFSAECPFLILDSSSLKPMSNRQCSLFSIPQ